MADGAGSVPAGFGTEFLDWFRQQTEAMWSALSERSPEQTLAEYVEAGVGGCDWQPGTLWLDGLGDTEITELERRWGLHFPPDYRLFLNRLHSVDRPMLCAHYMAEDERPEAPDGALATAYVERHGQYMALEEGPSFYNWLTDMRALEGQFAWLWEGLQFDVERNDLWPASWGLRPAGLDAQKRRVRELVEAAPKLIPIFKHRYLLAELCLAGNPVLSVYQSDIVVYGADLRDYLLIEFARLLGLGKRTIKDIEKATRARVKAHIDEYASIPFWGEFCTA